MSGDQQQEMPQCREGKLHLPQRLKMLWQVAGRRQVPVILQMSEVECGLACLAMILSYYGRKTSIFELRMQHNVDRDGLSALNIVRAARNYGLVARAISLQRNNLRDVLLPAIIHWQFNHFLIVEKWHQRSVVVVDPALGRRTMSEEEFSAGFTGIVLMFEPGLSFQRHSSRSPFSLRLYVKESLKQTPGSILQIFVVSLFLQLLGIIPPLLTKVAIDQLIPLKFMNAMSVLGMGMLLLLFSQGFFTILREWTLIYVRARIDMHMMLNLFKHLLLLPYSFFQQRSSGDLLSRMGSNATIRDTLSSQMVSTLLDGCMVIFYLLVLLWQSPPFGVLTMVVGLLQALLVFGLYQPIISLATQELTAQGKSQGYMAEALTGIATVKAAGAEYSAHERWSDLFFEQLNISVRRSYLTSIANSLLFLLRAGAPLALLWIGTLQVLQGSISIGTMLALTALSSSFLTPLSSLVSSAQQLQLVQAHLERLADIMIAAPEQEGQSVHHPPKLSGNIRLENVGFQYSPGGAKILHSINLTIVAGQKVAIVGRTGSGKSTLGRLLLGLYTPTEGSICYDDIPLQSLQYQEVRRQFGVVLQDSTIFSGTVMYNITFNQPTMDREQAVRAAHIAAIHDDIVKMPLGYETLVAESGSALSGGQRQRLALARAIAHHPSILLLDEATSNLDVVTEQMVAQNLEQLSCTQIIIAHRLSTIRNADLVLVLDQGTIVESGTHQELLQRNGYYMNLIKQQIDKKTLKPLMRRF